MFEHILQEPSWLRVWVFWMLAVNTLSVAFLRHVEARWVLVAWVGNLVLMPTIFELNGYNRLLGLSHVVCWTPLLVYLFRRRHRIPSTGAFNAWVKVLFLTNGTSLLVDYVDVARYALGDRS